MLSGAESPGRSPISTATLAAPSARRNRIANRDAAVADDDQRTDPPAFGAQRQALLRDRTGTRVQHDGARR